MKLLKNINILGSVIAVSIITLMIFISEFTGMKEVIFPEIGAVCFGTFISPKFAWNTTKLIMILSISICAILGYVISAFIPLNIFLKLIIAYIVGNLVYILSKTGFVPMISATILPVLIGTNSIIYPISATLIIISVMLVLCVLERNKLKILPKYKYSNNIDFKGFVKRFILFLVLLSISYFTELMIILAPPLIVAGVEFSNPKSKTRKKPLKLYIAMVISAFLGEIIRYTLSTLLNFPLFVSSMIAVIFVVVLLSIIELYVPPILAITVLAFLIEIKPIFFTLQIAIGFGIIVLYSLIVFKDKC